AFINEASLFQFPQLVQYFFTTDIKSRSQLYRRGFSHRFQCVKNSLHKFPPGKNYFSTQTNPAAFRRSYSCFSNSIGVGPDGRLGAASCRRTGGTLSPLLTCFAHFVSCRSASRFNSPSVIWRSIPLSRISRQM